MYKLIYEQNNYNIITLKKNKWRIISVKEAESNHVAANLHRIQHESCPLCHVARY